MLLSKSGSCVSISEVEGGNEPCAVCGRTADRRLIMLHRKRLRVERDLGVRCQDSIWHHEIIPFHGAG